MSMIKSILRRTLGSLREMRDTEYAVIEQFIKDCPQVVDVGCGTGSFVERDPYKRVGIDVNPENVQYCRDRNLNVQVGSATALPFPDNAFDAAVCSHLLQVFAPNEAAATVKELGRVVKPGGVVVISTLNWFKEFYQHPENVRPYPADALLRYFLVQHGSTSPMWPGMPFMKQEDIWLRRAPLVKLRFATRPRLNAYAGALNRLQYGLRVVKPWAYDSYVIKLRNCKAT